ncbi:MAG: alanine--glyoxylate aminotransferase family protein [Pseudomonadota bacterium]
MRYLDDKYRLMAPGPVQVSASAQKAMGETMIHHRTDAFVEIFDRVMKNLPQYFLTEKPVMVLPSTGTGGMEAALVNCFSAGDEIIAVVAGKFGARWADVAEVFGLKVHRLNVEWGHAIEIDEVKAALEQYPNAKGLMTQASETSTGTWQPIKAISKLIRNTEKLLIVDGITAVGCTHLPMDKWHLDVVVAGSQKAFGLPTGLSMVAMSDKAWRANEKASLPRYYFDLKKERDANEKLQTHFSAAVSLIKGLDVVVAEALERGMDHMVMRTQHLSESMRKAAKLFGMCEFSLNPSPSVTAIAPPDGIDGAELRKHLETKYNLTVMGGQDHLRGKIIRVGHMGDISNHDQLATIEALGHALKDLGADITEEKIDQALDQAETFLKMCSNV